MFHIKISKLNLKMPKLFDKYMDTLQGRLISGTSYISLLVFWSFLVLKIVFSLLKVDQILSFSQLKQIQEIYCSY